MSDICCHTRTKPQIAIRHWIKLRLNGDFQHNLRVLECKKGLLIVVRHPGNNVISSWQNFLPCMFCHRFFYIRELSRHTSNCQFSSKKQRPGNLRPVKEGRMLQESSSLYETICLEVKSIMDVMSEDNIGMADKNDSLIVLYGSLQVKKMKRHSGNSVSYKMRQLEHLLLTLRNICQMVNAHFWFTTLWNSCKGNTRYVCLLCNHTTGPFWQTTPALMLRCCAVHAGCEANKQRDKSQESDANDYVK